MKQITIIATDPQCPYCGAGSDTIKLLGMPSVAETTFRLDAKCTTCDQELRVVWRGKHADYPLLYLAYRSGFTVAELQRTIRWRDQAIDMYRQMYGRKEAKDRDE